MLPQRPVRLWETNDLRGTAECVTAKEKSAGGWARGLGQRRAPGSPSRPGRPRWTPGRPRDGIRPAPQKQSAFLEAPLLTGSWPLTGLLTKCPVTARPLCLVGVWSPERLLCACEEAVVGGGGSNVDEWDVGEGTTNEGHQSGRWRQGRRRGQDELDGEQS